MLTPLFLETGPVRAADFWPMIAPLALGLVAIYWLLPRPRPFPPIYGASAAALALLLAGWLIVRIGAVTPEGLLFYTFALLAVVFGGLLVTQHNPARAALSFAVVILSTCGLFLLQAAPFLMAATTIIYAGAIVVTFLFVLMLAQQQGYSDADLRSREPLLSCIAGFVLLGALLYILTASYSDPQLDTLIRHTNRVTTRVEGLQQRQAAGEKVSADEIRGALDEVEQLVGEPADRKIAGQFADWKPSNGQYSEERRSEVRSALANTQQAEAEAVAGLKKDGAPNLGPLVGELHMLQARVLTARNSEGMLTAPANVLLGQSEFSRPGPVERRDEQGRPQMPANNVEALGRSLFTDYLVGIELGGTLLLVATIGAIAIATRRTERVA